jgi:hypothetical protein
VVRSTIAISLSLAGVTCGLTLGYPSMRAVMDVGGFCAEGGPFVVSSTVRRARRGSWSAASWEDSSSRSSASALLLRRDPERRDASLWPALFLSLGWNFLEFAFDPAGHG